MFNQTTAQELALLGFGNLHQMKGLLFFLFFLIYIATVTGNLLIIGLIATSSTLHSPMYFFICNLSLCEIIFTSNIVPNMLYVIWRELGTMTMYGCFFQFYVYCSSGSVECLLLTAMAFDRYQAICNPLRYSSVMHSSACNHLVLGAWLFGFTIMSIITLTLLSTQSCGSTVIDHIFCDLGPILELSIIDTHIIQSEALFIVITVGLFPFGFIIVSYGVIFWTILRIPSKLGRRKAFSTCSAHLVSVCTYFGTLFTIYLLPSTQRSVKVNKVLSLLYIVVTPLFNPIIYGLRNREMKTSFGLFFYKVGGCVNI
ncbi:hypothetical protein XELAEV_18019495mg [Xenopus laevis]|uniref:Olfactory receptor n=1 Tax=Xenopus laevis TaxID=8355 RepID=A0A974DFB3_XENLA|nr:hypothetical protein XELAEV_18019495mg [Xenopus laevis]